MAWHVTQPTRLLCDQNTYLSCKWDIWLRHSTTLIAFLKIRKIKTGCAVSFSSFSYLLSFFSVFSFFLLLPLRSLFRPALYWKLSKGGPADNYAGRPTTRGNDACRAVLQPLSHPHMWCSTLPCPTSLSLLTIILLLPILLMLLYLLTSVYY